MVLFYCQLVFLYIFIQLWVKYAILNNFYFLFVWVFLEGIPQLPLCVSQTPGKVLTCTIGTAVLRHSVNTKIHEWLNELRSV